MDGSGGNRTCVEPVRPRLRLSRTLASRVIRRFVAKRLESPTKNESPFQGDGVCIKIMDSSTVADLGLIRDIEQVAEASGIRCQRGVLPRGGQDGAMIQRSRSGVRTAVFACPVKYIHTRHRNGQHRRPELLPSPSHRVPVAVVIQVQAAFD